LISAGPASPNGQDLLAEFVQYGQQRPFEEIVRRYAGMVFNVCLRVTKDKHDAEDATQAVFLTLALQVKRGTEIKALGPWLQQVAKRLSLDMRRSKKRRKTREERHHEEQTLRRGIDSNGNGEGLPAADLEEIKTILHEELNKLPAKYRLPLVLHYFGGMTRDEMAAELHCKASTLGVRIFRGRELLAGRLSVRGVNISQGTFAVMMAYTIKSVISHSMVRATSHAAYSLAAGHDGIGLVSARVVGLTRRAASAVALGKLKAGLLLMVIAGTTLGAGAKAMGVLPAIDVRQIITSELRRLIRPLAEPITMPLRVDARPVNAQPQSPAAPVSPQPFVVNLQPVTPLLPKTHEAGAPMMLAIPSYAMSSTSTGPVISPTSYLTKPNDWAAPVQTTVASADDSATTATSTASSTANSNALPAPSNNSAGAAKSASSGSEMDGGSPASTGKPGPVEGKPSISLAAAETTGPGMIASSANDLSVTADPASEVNGGLGASALTTTTMQDAAGMATQTNVASTVFAVSNSITSTTPARTIPAGSGTLTNKAGELSGWGTVNRTGVLDVTGGKVVADGHGVDRTLDLSSFTSIRNGDEATDGSDNAGWYAQAHGRLILSLKSSGNGSTLTWGEDPADPVLDMVNSVRLRCQSKSDASEPGTLSLLALDRTDLPSMIGLNATPIDLWEIDPNAGNMGPTELTVHYDSALVDALGADESTVELWTYGSGEWQPVDPASLSLDTTDHLISGAATNFSYIATAIPGTDPYADPIITAWPKAEIAPTVPEPTSLGLLALGSTLLLRRRRRR
jgi:RNA polymerase sigma factor (sigma-70 family)